jgi:hypothetical protein
MTALLLIGPELATDPALPALQERLRLRGAACVTVEALSPKALLRAAGPAAAVSWLATRDPTVIPAAATAGLSGVVLIGLSGEDHDEGVLVRYAPDLAAAPIVMVPTGGGCWH